MKYKMNEPKGFCCIRRSNEYWQKIPLKGPLSLCCLKRLERDIERAESSKRSKEMYDVFMNKYGHRFEDISKK